METCMENLYVDNGVETRAVIVMVNLGQIYYFTSITFTNYNYMFQIVSKHTLAFYILYFLYKTICY